MDGSEIELEVEVRVEDFDKYGAGYWDSVLQSIRYEINPPPEKLLFVFWMENNRLHYEVYDGQHGRKAKPLEKGKDGEAFLAMADIIKCLPWQRLNVLGGVRKND